MRIILSPLLTVPIIALGLSGLASKAAIYKESGGIVVIEAEHFDSRKADATDDHHWHIVPDDDGKDTLADIGDPPIANARGGKYLQALPDSAGGGQNQNQPADVGTEPIADYKVQITTPGRYQLWLRWGGYDGSSDSMYGEIVELRDGTGGKVNDWYRYARALSNVDFTGAWQGVGGPELNDAGGSDVPAAWDIPSAGTYTIRLGQREDGCAVDALILQLTTLPAPGEPGPPESGTATAFITITKQPADTAIATGQTATLSVTATGSSTPTYQWQKAAPGSTNFVDIAGATSATYTTATLTVSDNGTQYRAVLSITGLSIPSRAATVTVDVISPIAYRAVGSATFDKVTVVYSEPVDPSSATNAANYSIAGLTISGATLAAGGNSVVLTTGLQKTGTVYTVTIKDVKDLVTPANVLSPNPTTIKFTAWTLSKGAALQKYWENITPNNIDALRNDPRFPDKPTFTTIQPAFEYPANGANEAGSNYGNQLTAFLSPTVTGDYVFYVCSDDPSELYLSTDENPANKKLIAQETAWSNARQWVSSGGSSDLTSKRSDQFAASEWPTPNVIRLTAGKLYYMEALHTEGGGGDNVGATWQLPGGAEPVDGAPPIPGANLFTYLNPDVSTATITISSPADGATFAEGASITITVNATDSNGPIRKVEFFAEGKKLGESVAAPFSFTWSSVPAGRYSLSAAALDRQGFVITSPVVKVVVGNPPPEALFVIGTDSVPNLNASDAAIKVRLESLGFIVRVKNAPQTVTADADGKVLIVTSSTVNSGDVGDKFRTVAVPVVNWEQALQDNYLMTDNVDGTTRGTTGGQTELEIVNASHPLAAGLKAGVVTFVSDVDTFSWGLPPDGAVKIAQFAGDPTKFGIYAYDTGDIMFGGTKAPARRVMLPLGNNSYVLLTADGLKLFDAAIKWAANLGAAPPPPPAQAKFNPPLLQGGSLSLSWSGTGKLQEADAVTGPWNDAASQTSPQTVTVTGKAKFYRIKQ